MSSMQGLSMIDYIKSRKGELLVPLVMFGYATYYYLEVRALSGARTNLLLIGPVYWIMVLALVCFFVASYFKHMRLRQFKEKRSSELKISDQKVTGAFLGLTCAYVFSIEWLGFVFVSWLYMFFLLLVFSVRKKSILFFLPISVALFIYLTFDVWLGITLPRGWFL